MTTVESLRADIPALQDGTYLDYARHGPSPRRVVTAATGVLERLEYGTGSLDRTAAALRISERIRERVAAFIGATPEEVALTNGTTDGLNRVAGAFEWNPGDVVVRTDLEHAAGTLPWRRLSSRGVEVRVVEASEGRLDIDAFTDAVADAKLVCFSAVSRTCGTRLPVETLADIARDHDTFTLVDAAQVPGQRPMDVHEWGVDAVAAAGHKWLLAPQGSGFLYVRANRADELRPRAVGPRGVESATEHGLTFRDGARRFEVASSSLAPHVGLAAAIEAFSEIGIDTCCDRVASLTDGLCEAIPESRLLSPDGCRSGIVTIAVNNPEATARRLRRHGIVVRSLPETVSVRVSIHAVSTATEVETVSRLLTDCVED